MVQGIGPMNRMFAAMPARVEAAARRAMEQGAEELVAMMRRLAPVKSGQLRASIGWAWVEAPAGAAVLAESETKSRGLRIVVYAGGDDDYAFYARFVEFGTKNAKAHPFFFPAYRSLRKRIRSRVHREMKKAIKAG